MKLTVTRDDGSVLISTPINDDGINSKGMPVDFKFNYMDVGMHIYWEPIDEDEV